MRTRRNYRKRSFTKKRRGGLFGTFGTSAATKARVKEEQAAAIAAAKARAIQKARDIRESAGLFATGTKELGVMGAQAIGTGATRFGNSAVNLGRMGSKATADAAKRAYAAAPDAAKKALCLTVDKCIDWNPTIKELVIKVSGLESNVERLMLPGQEAIANSAADKKEWDMLRSNDSEDLNELDGGRSRRHRRKSHRKRGNRRTRK